MAPVCPKEGITPIESYSEDGDLEPTQFQFDRNGFGLQGGPSFKSLTVRIWVDIVEEHGFCVQTHVFLLRCEPCSFVHALIDARGFFAFYWFPIGAFVTSAEQ